MPFKRNVELNKKDIMGGITQYPVAPGPEHMPLATLTDKCSIYPDASEFIDWINYWHPGEWLWYGKLQQDHFLFDPESEILLDFDNYFNTESYNKIVPQDYVWDATQDSNDMDLENFVKLVWLTHDYIKANHAFQNPVGGHWCPFRQKILIHPGGCRNKVIKIFKDDVEIIFFNTGGFDVEWMDGLVPVDPGDLIQQGWSGSVVPEHGTLVPHLLKDLQSIVDGKAYWHERLKEKLSDSENRLKLYSDIRVPYLRRWHVPESEADVFVTFHNEVNQIDNNTVFQAVLCVLAEVNIDNDQITVEHRG